MSAGPGLLILDREWLRAELCCEGQGMAREAAEGEPSRHSGRGVSVAQPGFPAVTGQPITGKAVTLIAFSFCPFLPLPGCPYGQLGKDNLMLKKLIAFAKWT